MKDGNQSWRARECMRSIRVDENGKDGSGKRKGHQSTPCDCLRCPRGKIDWWGRGGKRGKEDGKITAPDTRQRIQRGVISSAVSRLSAGPFRGMSQDGAGV